MKEITAQGSYNAPTGEVINYDFTYPVFETLQDAIDNLGDDKVLKDVQRMAKIDANNTTRESVKAKNGHSTRKAMTEEQKAEAKAQRQADKELLAILKNKGLTASDLQNL